MSATVQFVVGGVLAGFGILVGTALVVLFQRVASLRRAIQAIADAIDSENEGSGVPDQPPSKAEDDAPTAPRRQHQSAVAIARHEEQQPAAALPIEGEGQRALKAISFDREVAAYNGLAANFSEADFEAFEQRWHPEPVAHTAGNRLAHDPQGEFWLIRTGAGDPHGLVVPGPEIVRKWELYYRSMGSLAAKNLLEGLYDIVDSAPLRLERPAIATQTERGWKVEVPGTFADG